MAVTTAELAARVGPGRRVAALAAAGAAGVAAGVLVVVLAGAAVVVTLLGEAVVAAGVVALAAAAVARARRRTDPRDLAPGGPWAGGREATLTGASAPQRRRKVLAALVVEGRPLAELRGQGDDDVVATLVSGPLYLEHRATEVIDVRLADDAGRTHAVAHLHLEDGVADWTLPLRRHTLRLRASVPAWSGAPRPTRRTLRDDDTGDHLVYTRHRPKAWVAVLPEDLTAAETLLCLWLVHLLDAHALLGRAWWAAPAGEWARVPADFPRRVGPGGFGHPNPHISGGGGAGGGAS